MKSTQKCAIIAVCLVTLSIALLQGYWMIKENGNVIVRVINYSHYDDVKIELTIDGEYLASDTFPNHGFGFRRYSKFQGIGNHYIEVSVPEFGMIERKEFSSYGVRWISIEFVSDPIDSTKVETAIFVRSSRLVIE